MNGEKHLLQCASALIPLPACMMIHYHYIRVYAFERILHGEFQPEDFKPPYIIRGIATRLDTGPTVQSADGYNNFFALNDCLLAGRSLLDSFLALSIKDLSTIPVIVYTRMIYVTVILAKLYISIQSLDSRFRDMVESTSLGFDSYISKLVALLRAQELQTMRVPRIFRKILERIATWCIEKLQLQVLGVDTHDSDVLRPMEFNDSPVEVDTRSCITTSSSLSPIRASSFASVGDPYLVEFQSIFPFLDRD